MKVANILIILLLFSYSCSAQNNIKKINASKSDLGLTLEEAIIKFGVDTSKSMAIDEPPGVVRGITAELPDSTFIYLQVDRKWFGSRVYWINDLLGEKVISIGAAYKNCEKEIFGEGFVWVVEISNPYCKKNDK